MGDPSSPTGVVPDRGVTVVVGDEQHDVPVDAERWAELATAVLASEGCVGELTLTFVDRDEMAALNLEHMGHDGPTDVLSFPLDPFGSEEPGPSLVGDVVICPAVAVESAPGHAGTVDDEVALLVVHGLLHIVGHDHAAPDETQRMRRRELELLELHHWHGPAPVGFRQTHEDEATP